jgi:trk system potassium uptake protein TrkH
MHLLRKGLTTTQIIILGFLLVILIGAVLLTTPMAAADGNATPFIDALFTATTCVCVTGLVTVTTATHWSLFGHIIILIMIQIGGLGVAAMTTVFMMLLGKKLSLSNRMLLGDAFNLDTLQGLVKFLRRVVKGTFFVEGMGALLYLPVFVPEYGAKGVWYAVFHAISAFCNAGIDLLGENSLMPYVHNVWLNVVTMLLIIVSGIGFIVWFDVIDVFRKRMQEGKGGLGFFKSLKLHSKLVLTMTAGLLLSGAVLYFIFEYHNERTIGDFTLGQKILAACFQSVTTRTAGFATISQKGLTTPSVVVTLFLMFTGGSPVSTAGGVKTSTIAIIILTVVATVRGREDVTCFKRRIPEKTVRKALAVVLISFMASVVAIIAMMLFEKGEAVDQIFEIYSALGTVGITRDYTSVVGLAGKIILCICMYLGRIGPITMVLVFTMRDKQTMARLPEENVTVG